MIWFELSTEFAFLF